MCAQEIIQGNWHPRPPGGCQFSSIICHSKSGFRRGRSGFTLIELLTVVAVITVLLGILIPVLAGAKQRARATVCQANLHHLGLGVEMYLDANEDHFWRYYNSLPSGRQWWFGLESPYPPATPTQRNRPLDKAQSVLAPYTANLATQLMCPDFPYGDLGYFSKFNEHAASYGYNLNLGPANAAVPTETRLQYGGQVNSVVVFADGLFFDFNPVFTEGHYLHRNANPQLPTSLDGYAHFRHYKQAQLLLMDGHVDSVPIGGAAFSQAGGAPSGNLTDVNPAANIYGQ